MTGRTLGNICRSSCYASLAQRRQIQPRSQGPPFPVPVSLSLQGTGRRGRGERGCSKFCIWTNDESPFCCKPKDILSRHS